MSERKSVTREELSAAINRYDRIMGDGEEWNGVQLGLDYGTADEWAGAIFDALPATPPASERVDAALEGYWEKAYWETVPKLLAAWQEYLDRDKSKDVAAIRAESDEVFTLAYVTEATRSAFAAGKREARAESDERVRALLARTIHAFAGHPTAGGVVIACSRCVEAAENVLALSDTPEDVGA